MELKITTCPVCGNRYFQEDYPKCPVCAGIIKKQGETEAMTEREFDMNGSGTLPLYTPETVREPKVETETDFGKTMPPDHASPKVDTWQHTTPVHEQKENNSSFQETEPPYQERTDGTRPVWDDDPSDRRSVKLPVVGWLVTLNGKHKGDDYQLRGYNTMVGRDPGNKIVLTGDGCISRTNCSIKYYSDTNNYFIYNAAEASNPVYVNKEPLHNFTELHAYDVIKLGRTEFVFIPLCGPGFEWSKVGTCD